MVTVGGHNIWPLVLSWVVCSEVEYVSNPVQTDVAQVHVHEERLGNIFREP